MGTVGNESTAEAAPAPEESREADATFTKWMVGDGPSMAGFVGGAVGEGAYTGTVLDFNPGDTTVISAIYRINGPKRPFTALVHVEQTGLQAVISGVVTDGWGKGNLVNGQYTQISCEHDGVTTDCYQGTLRVERGAER